MNAPRLFCLGFLTLFLELALIRYLSANIWNLGYFPNLVLLGVFLGMGAGFSFHHKIGDERSGKWFRAASYVLAGLTLLASVGHPTFPGFNSWNGTFGNELHFTARSTYNLSSNLFLFAIWFSAVFAIFFCVAQRTAKVFREFEPLKAYTLDIAGSCAGILTFMANSYFQLPAYLWFLFVIPLFLFSMPFPVQKRSDFWWPAALLLVCVAVSGLEDIKAFSRFPQSLETLAVRWSPYQKLRYMKYQGEKGYITANGIPHQTLDPVEELKQQFYQTPYTRRASNPSLPRYENVLILGAGAGNDVATALLNGVSHVDAVEIDPGIAAIGKKYHPAQPYSDARVHLTIDDGRAFMTRATKKYDLIIFALTDSLVKVSPMGQLRLENYLFTEDSMKRAYSLLSESGDLLLYNYYRRPWLTDKLEQQLYGATGLHPARYAESGDFAVMMAGKYNQSKTAHASMEDVDSSTDDWPFLYLKKRGIPEIYLGSMAAVTAFIVLFLAYLNYSAAPVQASQSAAIKLAFCAMGVAFLLLETKSVIQFALLFGTTWLNNSLVFLGALLSVLGANWTAKSLSRSWNIGLFILLLGSCSFFFFVPLSTLLQIESVGARYVIASILTFSPLYFANLIFSINFRDVAVPEHIFGWNLIGASMGGVLEYASLAVGYQALSLVMMACYSVVFGLLALAGVLSFQSKRWVHQPSNS